MATALLPEFKGAFDKLAAEHGDLLFADALLSFLVGGPSTGIPAAEIPITARRPPYDTPAPLLIHAALRKLCQQAGTERGMAQVRECLRSYALAGARRMMAKRAGKNGCEDCAARELAAQQVDAAIQRVADNRPQGRADEEVARGEAS